MMPDFIAAPSGAEDHKCLSYPSKIGRFCALAPQHKALADHQQDDPGTGGTFRRVRSVSVATVRRAGAVSSAGSGLRLAIPRFTRPKLADETEHGRVVPTSRGGGRGLVDESP